MNYRIRNWIVQSGTKLAVDMSGPGSVLADTAADWYKYCHVLIVGECASGAQAGDTYVNFPVRFESHLRCRRASSRR
jgi:hypothetical protein